MREQTLSKSCWLHTHSVILDIAHALRTATLAHATNTTQPNTVLVDCARCRRRNHVAASQFSSVGREHAARCGWTSSVEGEGDSPLHLQTYAETADRSGRRTKRGTRWAAGRSCSVDAPLGGARRAFQCPLVPADQRMGSLPVEQALVPRTAERQGVLVYAEWGRRCAKWLLANAKQVPYGLCVWQEGLCSSAALVAFVDSVFGVALLHPS